MCSQRLFIIFIDNDTAYTKNRTLLIILLLTLTIILSERMVRISLEELDTKALYAQPPPKFGHDLLKYFAIDPEHINLNHGMSLASKLIVIRVIAFHQAHTALAHYLFSKPQVTSRSMQRQDQTSSTA
jgi:hypothetical protein